MDIRAKNSYGGYTIERYFAFIKNNKTINFSGPAGDIDPSLLYEIFRFELIDIECDKRDVEEKMEVIENGNHSNTTHDINDSKYIEPQVKEVNDQDIRTEEEIVTSIREKFYGLKDIWDDLLITKINEQITIYSTLIYPSENNHFCGIIKSNGVTNEFYVKNDKLYFVYNYGNEIENRYYFNNNVEIVRWLDNNKDNILEKRNEEQKRLMDIFNQIY